MIDGMDRTILLFILILAVIPTPAAGQQGPSVVLAELVRRFGCTVLDGVPSVRVYADSQALTRDVASPTKDLGRTTILKWGNRHYWASREYREVIYVLSGVYHTYIEPRSGAFVKVVDNAVPLILDENPTAGPGFRFTETAALGLGSYIYWGDAATFDPDCTPKRMPSIPAPAGPPVRP